MKTLQKNRGFPRLQDSVIQKIPSEVLIISYCVFFNCLQTNKKNKNTEQFSVRNLFWNPMYSRSCLMTRMNSLPALILLVDPCWKCLLTVPHFYMTDKKKMLGNKFQPDVNRWNFTEMHRILLQRLLEPFTDANEVTFLVALYKCFVKELELLWSFIITAKYFMLW